jgi:hypothetical protein
MNKSIQNNPYIGQNNAGSFPQNNEGNNMQNNPRQNPYYQQNQQQPQSVVDSMFKSFDTQNFLKGALIGAVGAYLLTNENAQKTIFKTFAKGADMFSVGMEEMKERMEDAKAELEAEREAKA